MSFEAFLDAAWAEHADHPQDVADRIASSLHLVRAAEHVAPFAHLSTHVHGEHLGQWQRGIDLLVAMRDLPVLEAGAASTAPLTRNIASLRYAGGDTTALEQLSAEDRVCALATAASALAGRDDVGRAIDAFSAALELERAGLPAGSPGIRALAVGGNNLAASLEGRRDRSAVETRAMVAAAQAGVRYWTQAGTWLEVERAEYRLARSLLQAGEPCNAVDRATRCAAVCEMHAAPALEQFFAQAIVAIAHRAAGDATLFEAHRQKAKSHFDQVAAPERARCASELAELGE